MQCDERFGSTTLRETFCGPLGRKPGAAPLRRISARGDEVADLSSETEGLCSWRRCVLTTGREGPSRLKNTDYIRRQSESIDAVTCSAQPFQAIDSGIQVAGQGVCLVRRSSPFRDVTLQGLSSCLSGIDGRVVFCTCTPETGERKRRQEEERSTGECRVKTARTP
jgi:hypothetical protein